MSTFHPQFSIMYTLIILFYIALLGIIGMIWYKHHEAKTGHLSVVARLGRGSDHLFSTIFAAVHRFFSYINRHTFIALGHWVAFHILASVRKVYVELKHKFISHPQGKKMIDAVRGRGEVRKHGASFYLRKISANDK